jgi:agmatine deiminase
VPDEALRHERTFMQWPVSREVHPERDFLDHLQDTIARIANTIIAFEPVVMLMAPEHERAARRLLSERVEIWPIPTEDLWARDSGPLFVVDGQGGLAIRQLNFNGWGGKQIHTNDGQIAARVAERMGLALLDNGLVGEPGGVETDGEATLIAHESSWVNPNRNGQSKAEVAALLKEAYGAVIAAQFGNRDRDTGAEAESALARAYPGREIVTLNVDALGEVGGGIHCATREQPAT